MTPSDRGVVVTIDGASDLPLRSASVHLHEQIRPTDSPLPCVGRGLVARTCIFCLRAAMKAL